MKKATILILAIIACSSLLFWLLKQDFQSTDTTSSTTTQEVSSWTESTSTEEQAWPQGGSWQSGVAMPPPGSGNSNANVSITASSTGLGTSSGEQTQDSKSYTSTNADESAVVASSGSTLTLTKATISKASWDVSNTENSEFYGLNAGVIAKDSSTITIKNSTITTDARGSNAVFSTSKSTVNLSNVTIKTTATTWARWVDATYGGTINADSIKVSTVGAHSAAAATDRGEGNVTISNSTLETTGTDSPAIYSTGKFKITNTVGTANGAEAAVIEGQNSITLVNSVLTGMKNWGVMIYQSFSGDAQGTGGTFTMEGGSLTATDGPLFYSANTTAYINLKNVALKAASNILVKAAANSRWGQSGTNGATVTLTADTQSLAGNIVADSISAVNLILKNSSTLIGAIDTENTAKDTSITLDTTSTWNVSADSHVGKISGLEISSSTVKNITGNSHNVYYSSSENTNLAGKTYELSGGGKLIAE